MTLAKNQTKSNSTLVENSTLDRPAILLTGATHARELITIQMTMYQVLNMIHKALVE